MRTSLIVYGNPVAQARPKFARQGKFVRCYDPEKSRSFKETVKWQAIEQKAVMLTGALEMWLIFYLQRPKSLPKKVVFHTKKPDLDNLVKIIKDALEGICYANDSQISLSREEKLYSDKPRVEILIIEREGISYV